MHLGVSGASLDGGVPPWVKRVVPLIPCVLPFFTDVVLLGHQCQRDVIFGLEVAFNDCGRKDIAAATEGVVFKVERANL